MLTAADVKSFSSNDKVEWHLKKIEEKIVDAAMCGKKSVTIQLVASKAVMERLANLLVYYGYGVKLDGRIIRIGW